MRMRMRRIHPPMLMYIRPSVPVVSNGDVSWVVKRSRLPEQLPRRLRGCRRLRRNRDVPGETGSCDTSCGSGDCLEVRSFASIWANQFGRSPPAKALYSSSIQAPGAAKIATIRMNSSAPASPLRAPSNREILPLSETADQKREKDCADRYERADDIPSLKVAVDVDEGGLTVDSRCAGAEQDPDKGEHPERGRHAQGCGDEIPASEAILD